MQRSSKITLGLLGHKIGYSLSPIIQGASAKHLGIDLDYQVLDVATSEIGPAVKRFWEAGALGLNVTSPHKSVVTAFVTQSDGPSLNTLYRGSDGWHGVSTDGEGFALAMARNERELSHVSRLIVLGSGGAALSLVREIKMQRPHLDVTIMRRGRNHDATFAAISNLSILDWDVATLRTLAAESDTSTLLVQATSAPHHGDELSQLLPALETYTGLVADLCYRPSSRLLKAHVVRGGWGMDGIDMLIEQARLSQELWFGKAAPYGVIREALEGHI